MSFDTFWNFLMPMDVFWFFLMPLDVFRFFLMSLDVFWCILMYTDVSWCILMCFDVIWGLLHIWCLLRPFTYLRYFEVHNLRSYRPPYTTFENNCISLFSVGVSVRRGDESECTVRTKLAKEVMVLNSQYVHNPD